MLPKFVPQVAGMAIAEAATANSDHCFDPELAMLDLPTKQNVSGRVRPLAGRCRPEKLGGYVRY
jgi:hypothetical protein